MGRQSMKRFIALLLLIALPAWAGLPPTSSKVTSDSTPVTTFEFDFPHFTGTHTGTVLSLGLLDMAGGVTGLLGGANGGSGVNNSGTFTWGSNNITLTTGGSTSLTVPTSGTVATLAGSENLTNKTVTTAIYKGMKVNFLTKTANYTLTATDDTIFCDATSGAITMTLPTAVGSSSIVYQIVKIDSSANSCIMATTSSQTIDGAAASTYNLTKQWQVLMIQADGTEWKTWVQPVHPVNLGGTGTTSLTAHNLIAGNGSSAVNFIAPGTSGNMLQSDGTDWQPTASVAVSPIQKGLTNGAITASVSGNNLTVALKQADGSTDATANSPVKLGFRSSTRATGSITQASVTGALSITAASGATFGCDAAATNTNCDLFVYLQYNSGTPELCLSADGEREELSDTASGLTSLTISNAATVVTSIYCSTGRSSQVFRLIGLVRVSEATPGVYATTPSMVISDPVRLSPTNRLQSEVFLTNGNGSGSVNTKIRRFTNVQIYFGLDLTLVQDASAGDTVTVNRAGVYSVDYCDDNGGGVTSVEITVNDTAPTAAPTQTWAQGFRALNSMTGTSGVTVCVHATLNLGVGDVIYPHGNAYTTTGVSDLFHVIRVR